MEGLPLKEQDLTLKEQDPLVKEQDCEMRVEGLNVPENSIIFTVDFISGCLYNEKEYNT